MCIQQLVGSLDAKTTLQIVEESFSAKVPRSSAEVRRVFIHDIKEVEDVGHKEQQGDKRDDKERDEVEEKSKKSEATLRVRMKHEDDHGTNGDSNLRQSVRKKIMGLMIFFLLWSFPMSLAEMSSLLNHVVWN